jgi:hypothetical protein
MGRTYHLIATGSRDGKVRIWKVKPGSVDDSTFEDYVGGGGGSGGEEGAGVGVPGFSVEKPASEKEEQQDGKRWSATLVGEFEEHQ